MSFYRAWNDDPLMFGLPLITIATVGGTVVLVIILLFFWGLHYRGSLP